MLDICSIEIAKLHLRLNSKKYVTHSIGTRYNSECASFYSPHSAAYDSIHHTIVLGRLRTSFGFDGLFYNWIESYLIDRSQTVIIGKNSSSPAHLGTGVYCSPGFRSRSSPFSIYTSPIASLASFFSVPQQQYADDTQLCISLSFQLPQSNPASRRLPHHPARLLLPQLTIPQSR